MGADPNRDNEQRRRELEEIRRSFTEIGIRMGSLFEPAQPDKNGAADSREPGSGEADSHQADSHQAEPPAVAPAPASRQIPSWTVAAAIALVCLLTGGGVGYLLHRPAASPSPAPTPTVVTTTVVQTRTVAAPPCLQAAQRADETIYLLVRNIRDRRLSLALKSYTEASQACRKEAPP
jgi:hypothetical protein